MSRRQPAGIVDDRTMAAWRDLEDYLRAKQAKPLTIENYGWALVQLWQHGHGRCVLDFGHSDINRYLAWLGTEGGPNGNPASPATVDTRYRALRRFYSYWIEAGYVAQNPMRLVPRPRVPITLVPVIPEDAIASLINACQGGSHDQRRDLALIRLALSPGGPRASELANLTMDCPDLRGGVVLVHGKGGRDRLVPLGPQGRQALTRYLLSRGQHAVATSTARVFLGKRGPLTRSGLKQMLARRCGEAGIAIIRPHQLRHTAAAQCKALKMDPETAKRLFGWTTDAMYARYGAAVADMLAVEHGREIAAILERRQRPRP